MKQHKRPNAYSLSRIEKINAEVPERIKLIARCGGIPRFKTDFFKRNDGTVHEIRRVLCIGGTCECGCGRRGTAENGGLHPHEKLARGRGGIVSEENSVMILNGCHRKPEYDYRQVKLNWIRGNDGD